MTEISDELIYSMDWSDDPFVAVNTGQNQPSDTDSWRGVPMSEIYCSNDPWKAPDPSPIAPAYNHAVLFHIPVSGNQQNRTSPPIPQRGSDRWDKDHVRLPHSPQSLYPVKKADGTTELQNRWELIRTALLKPIRSSEDLQNAILSYNSQYSKHWFFYALHDLFNEHLEEEESDMFFTVTLPGIIQLALSLPELIQSPIPLLRQHHNRSISLSQQQVACLLANAFFCTFPRRNTSKPDSEYSSFPCMNFSRLFQCRDDSVIEKLKCLFHYFRRVTSSVLCGVLTFTRCTVEPKKCPNWSTMQDPIGRTPLNINSKGTIEDDGVGLLQVDFANKYLGGGVLNYGCVQEEIRFVICPELIVSMLFTEFLRPTEALVMIGCERFSKYTGYANSFAWAGNYEDGAPFDSSGRRKCAVVAIDALKFNKSASQYKPELIKRELNKAWVGFSSVPNDRLQIGVHVLPGVATGNWGCGAFGGSCHLKALLQIMACTAARRPIVYYTFGDTQLRDDVCNIYNFLARNNVTVGQLFKCLSSYHQFSVSNEKLYPFILQYQNDSSPKKVLECEDGKQIDSSFSGSNGKITEENKIENKILENTDNSDDMFKSDSDESFVDIEKNATVGAQEIEVSEYDQAKPSTSFFDEITKLEEMKTKTEDSLETGSNIQETTTHETVNEISPVKLVQKDIIKKVGKEKGKSPKRLSKKISDYFVPLKK